MVIDSSVIVKWLNQKDEENMGKADQILQDTRVGKIELIAPELAKYEVGNVLLKGKQLTPQEADISVETMYALPITFITDSRDLSREAFLIAYNYGITYYDASFLSLAKLYNATLVTANAKHQGRAKDIDVVSLRDYQL
ncbi:type II toxin-antitoxin system VapC family toxin [Patescibacteria group bacterium]|nr:type II toxin-antitoxin system VapC family toxin [Patescibacteria group bacterium]MBU4098328.1 type II toxin-antitoxin system VapC family toxin [Patescibacteria group bacterium]